MYRETVIISLGGSLVAPNEIDAGFLKNFKHCLQKYLSNKRFFIFVGGGKICRNYQKALLEFGADNKERDIIGIDVSRLNARVLKQVFEEIAYPEIITNPTKKISTRKDIVVAAGWKPGWSTDYCSIALAKNMGVKTIINLTNIDYVYELPAGRQAKTQQDFKNARALKEISWKDFRKIVGDKWSPGLSMPFDPRASKMADVLKIKVVIINGRNLERLEDFLNNKSFIGTTIK
ncbi:MAG: UMP kinase [Candidatus Staskawiczbacteria bacterium]|nr:UMP kinase [Candidatus Staskawiczbacteria bacterium]